MIEVLKSKIHRATVTEANINYIGSITIDEDLKNAANLMEHEKVHVLNINNGERIETYVIKGKKGSGIICLNGASARKFLPDDMIIIVSYAAMSIDEARKFKPSFCFPDKHNKLPKGKNRSQ